MSFYHVTIWLVCSLQYLQFSGGPLTKMLLWRSEFTCWVCHPTALRLLRLPRDCRPFDPETGSTWQENSYNVGIAMSIAPSPIHPHIKMGGIPTINLMGGLWHCYTHIISNRFYAVEFLLACRRLTGCPVYFRHNIGLANLTITDSDRENQLQTWPKFWGVWIGK